jgi:streptomycin 6-kinase
VLKIPPTRTAVVAEAAALRWWGEELAPKVLHVDEQIGVLLIERLRPGTAMRWESVADSPAVLPLLRGMHEREANSSLPLPRLRELAAANFPRLRRNTESKNALVDADLALQAEALFVQLFASAEHYRQVVLHGDVVPVNVLQSMDGLRVIDPRACVGEAAYDAAYWSVFCGYGHDARENVALLASELGLDEGRVLRWAWAMAVDRLLQIADSTHPGHADLCVRLRTFIAAARPDSIA